MPEFLYRASRKRKTGFPHKPAPQVVSVETAGMTKNYALKLNMPAPAGCKQRLPQKSLKNQTFKAITFNPSIFGGKPIIRGMRISVEHIFGMLAAGSTVEELLEGVSLSRKRRYNSLPCLLRDSVSESTQKVKGFTSSLQTDPSAFL